MVTEAEIKSRYKALHDDLSYRYYTLHELTKEEFDTQHGQIWADMEAELKTASDYIEPIPARDLATEITAQKVEIDDLKARLETLGKK